MQNKRKKSEANPESGISEDSVPVHTHRQLAKAISLAKKSSGGRLTVEQLAAKAALSSRHLARLFSKEMQMRPAQYLEHLRLRAAISRLEHSGDSVAQIAKDCGFGSRASMYRSFDRVLHISPAEYRAQHARRKNEQSAEEPADGTDGDAALLPAIEPECGKLAV